MELYNYGRSSASFRVRIALELKGLTYDYRSVDLVGGEQFGEAFGALSSVPLVPLLVDGDARIAQSMAIIEYLDETHPEPPLLPGSALERARIRSLALDIACEIHPLNNLRVLRHLVREMGVTEAAKDTWYRHWVEQGLAAVDRRLAGEPQTGRFCHGETPTLADCLLVPQIFNARRMDCRLDHVPTVMRVFDACMALPAFQRAQPLACPDFKP